MLILSRPAEKNAIIDIEIKCMWNIVKAVTDYPVKRIVLLEREI